MLWPLNGLLAARVAQPRWNETSVRVPGGVDGDLDYRIGQMLSTDVPIRTTAACTDGTLRLWLRMAGDRTFPNYSRDDVLVVSWAIEEL